MSDMYARYSRIHLELELAVKKQDMKHAAGEMIKLQQQVEAILKELRKREMQCSISERLDSTK